MTSAERNTATTRRAAIGTIAAAVLIPSGAIATTPGTDTKLIALGEELEQALRDWVEPHLAWQRALGAAHEAVGPLEPWDDEVAAAFNRACAENDVDSASDLDTSHHTRVEALADAIDAEEATTLEGLRAHALAFLARKWPRCIDDHAFDMEEEDDGRLFDAVAASTGLTPFFRELEAKLAAGAPQKPKTGSIVLDHFETQAPAPHITLAPFHDGKGWCIKAQASGFEPLLFGCYADSAKTAHWAAEQVSVHMGGTVPPLGGART